MSCWVHFELETEWKRLVKDEVGVHASGEDSPTVRLYWQIVEHRQSCEDCRDEESSGKWTDKQESSKRPRALAFAMSPMLIRSLDE